LEVHEEPPGRGRLIRGRVIALRVPGILLGCSCGATEGACSRSAVEKSPGTSPQVGFAIILDRISVRRMPGGSSLCFLSNPDFCDVTQTNTIDGRTASKLYGPFSDHKRRTHGQPQQMPQQCKSDGRSHSGIGFRLRTSCIAPSWIFVLSSSSCRPSPHPVAPYRASQERSRL